MPLRSRENKAMEIVLTQGQVAIVDDSDWKILSQYNWYARWDKYTQSFYALTNGRRDGKRETLYMHTFLMGGKADHRNHDTLDNRRSNLRLATRSQNMHNRRTNRNNQSGYKGVFLSRERWRAKIQYERQVKHLGMFDDAISAAKAYDAAARELFGEFAYLNFPETKK